MRGFPLSVSRRRTSLVCKNSHVYMVTDTAKCYYGSSCYSLVLSSLSFDWFLSCLELSPRIFGYCCGGSRDPIGGDIPPATHRSTSCTAPIRIGPPCDSAGAVNSFDNRSPPHGHACTGASLIVGAAGSASSTAAQ